MKKVENGNLDIRIIQLAKWQIPKSVSIVEQAEESKNLYLAIGYFDMIEAVKAPNETREGETMHPLSRAYCGLPRYGQGDGSEEFTMQELILFTDVEEKNFSTEKIEHFWKSDSLLMYISLIHVDNESNIDKIIERIKEEFQDKEYLYYFSFDYSGIVLLAKNMKIEEYTASMFRLNYKGTSSGKLIRDSFSMFGLNKKQLHRYFEQAKKGYGYLKGVPDDELFSVVVNIGVQNFNTYKEFIKEVKMTDIEPAQYGLLGRHDISLSTDNCNLKWLIYIQYLLDKYTKHEKRDEYEKLFSTYETFIKVQVDDTLTDADGNTQDGYYENVKKHLDKLCAEFSAKLTKKKKYYNGEYQIPIRAVKHSVLSILKNRFAEDFVICMYSSFCEMLSYLIEKMSSDEDDPEAFEACYEEYFRGLNSLVNSAMHSERQFIQATAFNALIYDVPSKIMAFYVAIIHDIQSIIKSNLDKNYTFLLTPSFSNEISVKMISYQKEELPHDRILMVSINEKSLYNPKGVSRRMAHEIAHYVGDEIRDRQCRKECLELSVIYIVLNEVFHSVFVETQSFYALIEKIREALMNDERFNLAKMNYSEDLTRVGAQIVEEFIANQEILRLLDEHVFKVIKDVSLSLVHNERKDRLVNYISRIIRLQTGGLSNMPGVMLRENAWSEAEIEIFKNLVMDDIKEKINHINRDARHLLYLGEVEQSVALGKKDSILNQKTIGEFANMLKSIYSEAFADIQMILVLNFGYEDYLNGFLIDESIDLKNLPKSMEDLSRISMVVLTMNLTGMWNELKQQGCWESIDTELYELHSIICSECAALLKGTEWEDEENLEDLRKAVQEFRSRVGEAVENENAKQESSVSTDVSANTDGRMVNVYINNQLLEYLLGCVGRSIVQYLKSEEKMRKICSLRKTLKTVIQCTNMRETFKTVCAEVKEYRETVFSH